MSPMIPSPVFWAPPPDDAACGGNYCGWKVAPIFWWHSKRQKDGKPADGASTFAFLLEELRNGMGQRIHRLDSLQLFLSTAVSLSLLSYWYVVLWISNDNPNDLWAVYLGSYDELNYQYASEQLLHFDMK
jgi:hypothetical protein